MNKTLVFIRTFFFILSIIFLTTYMVAGPERKTAANFAIGIGSGALLGLVLIGFDRLFRRFNLRSFNIATLGIIFGYFMGLALVKILAAILEISSASIHLAPNELEIIKISLFLFGIYLGTLMTLRSADELYISIPFVKFSASAAKKRELVIDSTVLSDARIIDLATSGLIDNQLVVPQFLMKELQTQAEATDEAIKAKGKRALEVVKKLESIPHLGLVYNDTDFPDVTDYMGKLVRLARFLDAAIITADITKIKTAVIEGIRFINIHSLSNALKPLMQPHEKLKIKIQHHGKDQSQGVGYLDDGSMVVVNGGGIFVGKMVDALVISVVPGRAGRMIFCKMVEDGPQHEGADER
jgi:uncharacterized protein YacL